jgi:hypothetical protein
VSVTQGFRASRCRRWGSWGSWGSWQGPPQAWVYPHLGSDSPVELLKDQGILFTGLECGKGTDKNCHQFHTCHLGKMRLRCQKHEVPVSGAQKGVPYTVPSPPSPWDWAGGWQLWSLIWIWEERQQGPCCLWVVVGWI